MSRIGTQVASTAVHACGKVTRSDLTEIRKVDVARTRPTKTVNAIFDAGVYTQVILLARTARFCAVLPTKGAGQDTRSVVKGTNR